MSVPRPVCSDSRGEPAAAGRWKMKPQMEQPVMTDSIRPRSKPHLWGGGIGCVWRRREKKSAWLLLRLCPVIICQHHSPSTTEGSIQACLAGGMTTRWGGVNGFFRERGEGYLLDVCLWIPWPASTLIRHCLHCRRMDVGRAWKGNGARWSRGSETGH